MGESDGSSERGGPRREGVCEEGAEGAGAKSPLREAAVGTERLTFQLDFLGHSLWFLSA